MKSKETSDVDTTSMLELLKEADKKYRQPKRAYAVDIDHNLSGKPVLILIEYELLSLYFLNDAPRFVTGAGQIIWDSDESSIVPRPRFASQTSGVATRCSMFLDVSEAHTYLQGLLIDRLYDCRRQLNEMQQKIKNLEQIKINNLPKETYVSPITGEEV